MKILTLEEAKEFVCKALKYKRGILPELQFQLNDGKGSLDAFIGGITKSKAEEFLISNSVLGLIMGIDTDDRRLSFIILRDTNDKYFVDVAHCPEDINGFDIYHEIMANTK